VDLISPMPNEPRSVLGAFLKKMRRRIPLHADRLGASKRLPIRCGRRVTQEEIAEAVGVSRNWYRMLECGTRIRASTKLLARLAQALGLSSDERMTLLALALPEIWMLQVPADSTNLRTSTQSDAFRGVWQGSS
jgi:transcriptional regulator with XRE-family HTH domain